MAVTAIQVKRRNTGASGAPSSLQSGEIAWQNVDKIFYVGAGDNGSGVATSIDAIGGAGAFMALTGNQTVAGIKTFSSFPITPSSAPTTDYQVSNKKYVDDSVVAAGGGDMTKAVYDPGNIEENVYDVDFHIDGTVNHVFTAADDTKLAGIEAGADITDAVNIASSIVGVAGKTTPVGADTIPIIDSEAANALKELTFTNLMAYINSTLQAGGIFIEAGDSADSLVEGSTNKFLTAAERTKVGHITVTQAVDLDAIETRVNSLDAAVVLRGSWDASAGTFPGGGTAQAGDSYIVSVAGTVNSVAFAVGDRIIAITDNASTTTFAANWFKADYTDQVLSVAGLTGAITASDLRDALDLVIGTDVQAYDDQLAALAQLSVSSGSVPYFTGTGPTGAAVQASTSYGRSLLNAADAAALQTLAGLGTMATQNHTAVNIDGGTIDGVVIDGGTF
jgi:hypothetical protein